MKKTSKKCTWRQLSRMLQKIGEKYAAIGGKLINNDMYVVIYYQLPLAGTRTFFAIRRNGVEWAYDIDELRAKCGSNEVFAVVKCSTSDGKIIDVVVNERQ